MAFTSIPPFFAVTVALSAMRARVVFVTSVVVPDPLNPMPLVLPAETPTAIVRKLLSAVTLTEPASILAPPSTSAKTSFV